MRIRKVAIQPYEDRLVRKLTGLFSGEGEDLLLQAPSEDVQRYHRLRASIPSNLWRWRKKGWMHAKFLHLVDSQVCLRALSRGRSTRRKLRRTLAKISSLLLVSGSHNPADRPSQRPVKRQWVK